MNISGFAVDPYNFNKNKNFDHEEYINRDVGCLKRFFGKTDEEIYEASKSYTNHEDHLFNFVAAIKFWHNAIEVQLTNESTNLSTLISIFAVEAIVGGVIPGNSDRFRSFILHYLSRDDKVALVSGYTFGVPYTIGQVRARKKHLCYRAAALSEEGKLYRSSFCSSGANPLCTCRDWLNAANEKKINRYVNIFGSLIYQMRCSVVHDGQFVQFTSMPFPDPDLGMVTPTTSDAYSVYGMQKFTSYDTDITVGQWHKMMKSAAWKCFEDGSRIKTYKKARLLKQL